jgi:hypothetical protein
MGRGLFAVLGVNGRGRTGRSKAPLVASWCLGTLLIALGDPVTAQTDAIHVAPDGKVGIGTDSPDTLLHLLGDGGGNNLKVTMERTVEPESVWELVVRSADGAFAINAPSLPGAELILKKTGDLLIRGILYDSSSRERKMDFATIDSIDVLAKVSQLPLSEWSYKQEAGIRHFGPMAEDFFEVFGLGNEVEFIAPGDVAGIALAAVRGLNEKLGIQDQQIHSLQAELEDVKSAVRKMRNK